MRSRKGVAEESQRTTSRTTGRTIGRRPRDAWRVRSFMTSRCSSCGEHPAKHRASEYALKRCLEGFAALDGHKSMPSREPMCPGGL